MRRTRFDLDRFGILDKWKMKFYCEKISESENVPLWRGRRGTAGHYTFALSGGIGGYSCLRFGEVG